MHLRNLLFVLLALVLTATGAHAAIFTVDRTDDNAAAKNCTEATANDCSLRGAILAANALSEASTINVPAGTYVLSQASTCTFSVQPNPTTFFTSSLIPLCLSKQVTIQGAGAATTIIDGNQLVRVLVVSASAVAELRGVTITQGRGDSSFGNPSLVAYRNGGGIANEGALTLTDSVVRNNLLPAGNYSGGGIYNKGILTLFRSAVSNNYSTGDRGGGIFNEVRATLTVADSTISDNSIGGGGGIAINGGTVTITGSTISGNDASVSVGGGIFNGGFPDPTDVLTITNSTISGNTSLSSGGGIYSSSAAAVHLNNVTITNNTGATNAGSGGGVVRTNGAGLVTLQSSIISGNRDPGTSPDCGGFALSSRGYNLIQNTTGCVITGDTTGNVTGIDPELGLLVDNGGFTQTHALGAGSPAIDAGNPAAPGSGGAACTALDQHGFLRPRGAACDIGAFERGGVFSLTKVTPNTGGNTGVVTAFVSGDGFVSGTTVKLTQAGQPDIVGNLVHADVGGSAIAATFDLVGRSIGPWDVVAMNPDGTSETLAAGFAIEEPRVPEFLVDVMGPSQVRVGRPARFTVLVNHRGNVDAVGIPLLLTVPAHIALNLRFQVTPPPPQAGQVEVDWSQEPVAAEIDGITYVSLLLPVVPDGITSTLEVTVTAPPLSLGMPFEINAEIGPSVLDSEGIARLVDGARAYAQRVLGVDIPQSLTPQLEEYATTQLQNAVAHGRDTAVASVGRVTEVYSSGQLVIDLAQFGAEQTMASAGSVRGNFRLAVNTAGRSGLALRRAAQATGWAPLTAGWLVWLVQPSEAYAQSAAECAEMGLGHKSGGGCTNCHLGSFVCRENPPVPRIPVGSHDPNNKVGSTGVGTAHFLAAAGPLPYAVFFENVETATAPAQEVVITDQLDGSKVDFDTFSLGPINFGATTVMPPPGLSEYSTSVDLRPGQDLIVGIDARLDKDTGLITWTFTSIDPATVQFTEDPLAGFLPPNITAPEGDGSVLFSINPKSGLASGTAICNGASIVFDTNAAIGTPEWCNTIDEAPPSSAVQSLSVVQFAPDFPVQWAGTDQHSGIRSYSVYVSDNGGPFSLWLEDTTELSAVFPGIAEHSYAFYSVAHDLIGNGEAAPSQPDATTRVVGAEVCNNCLDDDGDGRIDWRDEECVAQTLSLRKGVLSSGRNKITLSGSFAPATIAPPAQGVALSIIRAGTGMEDPDLVLACVQIPPGASGWVTSKTGTTWRFKDERSGSLGDPDSRDALKIRFNARKQRYELSVTIKEAEVGVLADSAVSAQLSIGGQGWEHTQAWYLKAGGSRLVTP